VSCNLFRVRRVLLCHHSNTFRECLPRSACRLLDGLLVCILPNLRPLLADSTQPECPFRPDLSIDSDGCQVIQSPSLCQPTPQSPPKFALLTQPLPGCPMGAALKEPGQARESNDHTLVRRRRRSKCGRRCGKTRPPSRSGFKPRRRPIWSREPDQTSSGKSRK